MHEYYAKKAPQLKKGMFAMLKHIKPETERIFGKSFDEAFEEIWSVYHDQFLENFPYIGGDRISGTRNLTGAYYFAAFGRAARPYGLELEEWGRLSTECYHRFFASKPKLMRLLARLLFAHAGLVNKALRKKDAKNRANAAEYPGSFETAVQEPTEDYPVIYHNLVCPLYSFARKMGCEEYMPYICNLDYVMFSALGIPLYREKTLADGDDYCDFKMKKDAAIPGFWPPHVLDEKDPLK